MDTLEVELGAQSYPIHIGRGLIADRALLSSLVAGKQVFIVSNTTVGPLYRCAIERALDGFQVDFIDVPDGEEFKTLETLETIFTALLERRHDRSSTMFALGGGVVGDMAGFAAASYLRGVRLVQLPTTLLAQVDSSVGGKTAVNHPLGKNMIGAFYQPRAVIIDLDVLATLPAREFRSGLGEVIKHGALWDGEFFEWLEGNIDRVLALDTDAMAYLVRRNCEIKAEVVSADERETGIRALLNLGHTFAHAIEVTLGYGTWLHGEAVAAGLVMAADLSVRGGMLEPDECRRLKALVRRAGLPCAAPERDPAELRGAMEFDKKSLGGRLRFVLLERLGKAVLKDDVQEKLLRETLAAGAAAGEF